MALTITPLLPHLGARVEGVDLACPLDDAMFGVIAAAFDDRSVLVFGDQHLTDEQQMRFSERFRASPAWHVRRRRRLGGSLETFS